MWPRLRWFFQPLLPFVVLVIVSVIGSSVPVRAAALASPVVDLTDPANIYELLGHALVLDDPNGDLNITDVAKSTAFRSASADSQPPDDGVRWYRLIVSIPPDDREHWYIDTTLGCSSADLYLQRSDGGFTVRRFGYRVPFARHPAPGAQPALELGPLHHQTIFVRLQCDRATQDLEFATGTVLAQDPYVQSLYLFDSGSIALIVLAFGLALITRSPPLALAGLSGIGMAGSHTGLLNQWFPTVSFPPIWLSIAIAYSSWQITLWLYYRSFLELRNHDRRWTYFLTTMLALTIAGLFLFAWTPLAWQSTPIATALNALNWLLFISAATGTAFVFARRGNRSAWFTVAGGLLMIGLFTLGHLRQSYDLLENVLQDDFNIPDLMLLILAVGDRLRQTSLAREHEQREKEVIQSALVERQHEYIADVERRNASFARFVPTEFLHQLGRADLVDVQLGDHVERDMTVLFSDIRGFTAIAERLAASETFDFVNTYLARAGPLIRAHGGFIDKYIGDAIVALFPNQPSDALDAASALHREVRRLNEERARHGGEPLAIGIGINYGRLMLGTIGETQRIETTVIADSVNVASRLETLTKVYGASTIVSANLVAALADRSAYCLRELGDVVMRGHERAVGAFEVFDGDPHELVLHKNRSLATFSMAIEAYEKGDHTRSRQLFEEIAAANPLDRAAAYFRDRLTSLADAGTATSS